MSFPMLCAVIEILVAWVLLVQLAMRCVRGVEGKMDSSGMETLTKGTCLLSSVHLMTVRYPPLLAELITLLPGPSPRKLCTVGVGKKQQLCISFSFRSNRFVFHKLGFSSLDKGHLSELESQILNPNVDIDVQFCAL